MPGQQTSRFSPEKSEEKDNVLGSTGERRISEDRQSSGSSSSDSTWEGYSLSVLTDFFDA